MSQHPSGQPNACAEYDVEEGKNGEEEGLFPLSGQDANNEERGHRNDARHDACANRLPHGFNPLRGIATGQPSSRSLTFNCIANPLELLKRIRLRGWQRRRDRQGPTAPVRPPLVASLPLGLEGRLTGGSLDTGNGVAEMHRAESPLKERNEPQYTVRIIPTLSSPTFPLLISS